MKCISPSHKKTETENSSNRFPSIHSIHAARMCVPGVRVAVVAHLFYLDIAHEIYGFLRNITEPFDLIITTPHETSVDALLELFAPLASGVAVCVTENIGRDVGPFMALYRIKMLESYDAVLKLHSKKSFHIRSGSHFIQSGNHWRLSSFQFLCGTSQIVRRTIALLRTGKVGIVGPQEYYLEHKMYWGYYRRRIHQLLHAACGENIDHRSISWGFFAGTMFWFSPHALKKLHDIPRDMLKFEPEQGQKDGTLAHVLERLFGILSRRAGYTLTSLELAGRDFSDLT